jgi:hypothetical protein
LLARTRSGGESLLARDDPKRKVIAHAPTAELHQMVGQGSLEQAFVHLVADRDAEQTATEIVEVMSARAA